MFDVDSLRDEVREKFVGLVVVANYPCDCRLCEKGTKRLVEEGRQLRTTKRVHIVIKPLELYENFQHAWYNESKIKWSSMGAFVTALNLLLGFRPKSKEPEEQWKEVKKFLEGKIFTWDSVNPIEFVSKVLQKEVPKSLPDGLKNAREVWIPIEAVKPEDVGIENVKKLHKEAVKEWKDAERDIDEMEAEVEEYDLSDIL